MSSPENNPYTAKVVGLEDHDITAHIHVRPPFVPSKEFLDFCAEQNGVSLDHFVTTPNTTVLGVTIGNESVSGDERSATFIDTATFITNALRLVDDGVHMITASDEELRA